LLASRAGFIGMILAALLFLTFAMLPLVAGADANLIDYTAKLKPPSTSHIFGTDHFGRDFFWRFIYGGRLSIGIALATLTLSVGFGIIVGVTSAMLGGAADAFIMRAVDILLAIPGLVLVLMLVGVLGIGTKALILAIAVSIWPLLARLSRAAAMTTLVRHDVVVARMAGVPRFRIMTGHILPVIVSEIAAITAFYYAEVLGFVAGLSFVGLGIQPPTAEWGSMLNEARPYFSTAPWLIYFPVLGIFAVTVATLLIAFALRESIAPVYRGEPAYANENLKVLPVP
jgi:ABC-type dipeptide/oligopeptide/nickel transport system permease subunit